MEGVPLIGHMLLIGFIRWLLRTNRLTLQKMCQQCKVRLALPSLFKLEIHVSVSKKYPAKLQYWMICFFIRHLVSRPTVWTMFLLESDVNQIIFLSVAHRQTANFPLQTQVMLLLAPIPSLHYTSLISVNGIVSHKKIILCWKFVSHLHKTKAIVFTITSTIIKAKFHRSSTIITKVSLFGYVIYSSATHTASSEGSDDE